MSSPIRILVLLLTLFGLVVPAWSQEGDRDDGASYLFQVVLLIGDTGGESELEGVSGNVSKALDDVKEFLPFKSYRVLDTALLRSAGRVEGLLSGPEGQDYSVEMAFHRESGKNRIIVQRFSLTDLGFRGTPAPPRKAAVDPGQSTGTVAPRAAIQRRLIESSFSLHVGETIIVGSSKLNGGSEALLVLLTAIP